MNADPLVMAHFPVLLSRAQSDACAQRWRARIDAQGWGLWAVELRHSGAFIGFIYMFVLGYALGRLIGYVYNLSAMPRT